MPHYFVIDARFSSRRGKLPRDRSGSISVASLNTFPTSPVNRFAQSMGPARPITPTAWSRHTTPAMSTRRMDFYCDYSFVDSWDHSYRAKSNRRSVWQRFAENVDKCVFRVVSKFYK
ncbi:hypothetical protein PHYSODRAFT_508964 [Phytophthora sojae]|uniref:Uncharacterized protein n=1 Tax=Phytophthora sojae (strain P6497) TaxID=1094619 RepID=G4ZMI3_PHYSP|nr:hypothetical protein PHYSODRAFT_508964 [Phytophthora sojae]EGZ15330.1 hypothetical protein PHYSODRAFT_508964 [Phytophthora sojae]|eukprot:XP_009529079.1 hypothetical protein PHYSODRAFT_508964 [Phytophthora sojae]